MAFLSVEFIILLAVTFFLYAFSAIRCRNWYLLAASMIFIGWNNLSYLLVALMGICVSYTGALYVHKYKNDEKKSKIAYLATLSILLSTWILVHNADCLIWLLQITTGSVDSSAVLHNLLYPLGMSFYTFQAIGYLTDVYWQEDEPEKNLLDFSLYMLLFFKFLSGPIERFGDLIGQIRTPQPFKYENTVYGLKLICLGMMKKLLIANYLSPYTSEIFSNINDTLGLQLLMVALIYPIELYTDFSGYTDMAMGGARMFGIKLTPNFNFPFSAQSTTDLWRRWHMSLSFWVRDYLFVPLTASLRSWKSAGIYVSLLVTFSLLGLWHGIGLPFLIYGLIQGLLICWEMRTQNVRRRFEQILGKKLASSFFVFRTYVLFAFSLIFFKAETLSDALLFFSRLSFSPLHSWKEMNIGMSDHFCLVAGLSFLALMIYEHYSVYTDLIDRSKNLPLWARWSIYFSLVFTLFSLGMFQNDNFIYLQF